MALGSTRGAQEDCSRLSNACTPWRIFPARALGWRLSNGSSNGTAARSGRKARPARERPSSSVCRQPRNRSEIMSKGRILVVEDEAVVAADLQQRLTALGYEVTGTAASGREALRLAEAQPPDLALMDIKLEGELDGIQAASRLAEQFQV